VALVECLEAEQVGCCLCGCHRAPAKPVDGCHVVIHERIHGFSYWGISGQDILVCNGAHEFNIRVCDGSSGILCQDEYTADCHQEGSLPE